MIGQKACMVKSLSWINPFTKSIAYHIIIIIALTTIVYFTMLFLTIRIFSLIET